MNQIIFLNIPNRKDRSTMCRFVIGSSILSFLLLFRLRKWGLGATFLTGISGVLIFSGIMHLVPRLRNEKRKFEQIRKKEKVVKLLEKSKLQHELEYAIVYAIAISFLIFCVFWAVLNIRIPNHYISEFCILIALSCFFVIWYHKH